jgi:hypothetical protein
MKKSILFLLFIIFLNDKVEAQTIIISEYYEPPENSLKLDFTIEHIHVIDEKPIKVVQEMEEDSNGLQKQIGNFYTYEFSTKDWDYVHIELYVSINGIETIQGRLNGRRFNLTDKGVIYEDNVPVSNCTYQLH